MAELFFTEDHEWIKVVGDVAIVGITDYAQQQLGDLVFVELPEIGSQITKGDSVVVVESVKAASDVFAPIDGSITEVNAELQSDPALVNQHAEGEGWLWKMKLSNLNQLASLMDHESYRKLVD